MKYLRTTTANGIYDIEVAELKCEEKANLSNYICFKEVDEPAYNELIVILKSKIEEFWRRNVKDFVSGKYWYVTTSYPSHICNLHVVDQSQEITKKENIENQCYNYFLTKEEAEELCSIIKGVFKEHNISLK